jgi:hypothetical protein
MSNALKFKTVANGVHKRATTHLGVIYDVRKVAFGFGGARAWNATVTSPHWSGDSARNETDNLASGVTYQEAIKAANVSAAKSF